MAKILWSKELFLSFYNKVKNTVNLGKYLFCQYLATMTRFQRKSCESPSLFQLQSSSINHLQRSTWVYPITWVSNLWDNYKINPPGNLKSGWNNLVFSKIMTERSVIEKLFITKMTTAGQFCFWMYISTAGPHQTGCKEWGKALFKCARFHWQPVEQKNNQI